jgi:hypothetical protein
MSDVGYVIAAYGVVLGGMALYAVSLWRRRRRVRGGDEAR